MAEVKAFQPYLSGAANPIALGVAPPIAPAEVIAYGGTFKETGHTEWVDFKVHETGFTAVFPPNTKVLDTNTDVDFISSPEGKVAAVPTYAAVTSRSYHSNGVNALLMDGSVRFVTNSIAQLTWRRWPPAPVARLSAIFEPCKRPQPMAVSPGVTDGHAVTSQDLPMLTIRKGTDRGSTDFGWLDSRHTFSFGDYQDPRHHQFRALRVINDDRVAAGGGFPTHPHRDMEILTCVLSGAARAPRQHGQRRGDSRRRVAGDDGRDGHHAQRVQPVRQTEPVHLLQIWLFPDKRGHTPGLPAADLHRRGEGGKLRLVASPDGEDGSLVIHQDARVYQSKLATGQTVTHELQAGPRRIRPRRHRSRDRQRREARRGRWRGDRE